jgi:hypothetical protein
LPEARAHTQTTTPTPTPTRTHPRTHRTHHPPTNTKNLTHPHTHTPTHPHTNVRQNTRFPEKLWCTASFFVFFLKKRKKSNRPEPGRDVPPRDARADASPVVSLRCIRQHTPASVSTSNNIPSILLYLCPDTEAHGSRTRYLFSPSSTYVSSYLVIRMLTYADVYSSPSIHEHTGGYVRIREDRCVW